LRVVIPDDNLEERKYIIDVLLKDLLGLSYKIEIKNIENYELILKNGKKLVMEDHFFHKFSKNLEYLNEQNIPQKVKFTKNDFIVERDIPVIYGNSQFSIINFQLIRCGIDIFASSFFMLTRWEEYVNKTRDRHNRFPAFESLAYKNNFLDRPVVNEYIEMLWNMLEFLGCKQKREKRKFKFILTHDIDIAGKFKLKDIISTTIRNRNIYKLVKYIKRIKLNNKIFDTYEYLMDFSESFGIKSYFFLHSSSFNKRFDEDNRLFLKSISKKILKRGHYIGYHPSYNAFNNLEIFLKNKKEIENLIETKLKFGRMHYLRFEIPFTWDIWEKAKMEWDSSLMYADRVGFRCGICNDYFVFDFLKREKLSLKEKPLILMDTTFTSYDKNNDVLKKMSFFKEKIKRYKGDFVLLWHNNNYFKFKDIFFKVLNG